MNKGFIKPLLLVLALLIILAYFGYDIREYLSRPEVQEFLKKTANTLAYIGHTFILNPLAWLWEKITSFRS